MYDLLTTYTKCQEDYERYCSCASVCILFCGKNMDTSFRSEHTITNNVYALVGSLKEINV